MANSLHCDIVSVKESIFTGSVRMLVAHGNVGDLGVLPGHAPLLTQLHPGPVRVIKENGDEELFYVSGGVLEVQAGAAGAAGATGAAMAALAEVAGQLRTLQKLKNRA